MDIKYIINEYGKFANVKDLKNNLKKIIKISEKENCTKEDLIKLFKKEIFYKL